MRRGIRYRFGYPISLFRWQDRFRDGGGSRTSRSRMVPESPSRGRRQRIEYQRSRLFRWRGRRLRRKFDRGGGGGGGRPVRCGCARDSPRLLHGRQTLNLAFDSVELLSLSGLNIKCESFADTYEGRCQFHPVLDTYLGHVQPCCHLELSNFTNYRIICPSIQGFDAVDDLSLKVRLAICRRGLEP